MKKYFSFVIKSLAVGLVVFSLFIASKPDNNKFGKALSHVLNANADLYTGSTYIVYIYFKDKGPDAGRLLLNPSALVSGRSLERRSKVMPANELVGYEDLPLFGGYVHQVSAGVLKIRHELRWFNAVSAEVTEQQLYSLAGIDFIKNIELVERMIKNKNCSEEASALNNMPWDVNSGDRPLVDSLNYGTGPALIQITQIHVNDVHNQGIFGQGVLIANFDVGFKNQTHEAFTTLPMKILKQFDFQLNIPYAGNVSGGHGTSTLSLVGGYKPGQMIGPAFRSAFMIARTEVDSFERPIEMDHWTAAAQWADSSGADIITSSLGYLAFDSGYASYTWSDMNGNTLPVTLAAKWAARHGIVVCNSAGNNGQNISHNTLNAPADADSIITVGAVTSDGTFASFSSVGPTTDTPARIKPDVLAMGSGNYVADINGNTSYSTGSGTSYSCPLTAGVAGLMLSANKNLTPLQVRGILRKFAGNNGSPNNTLGWGLINAQSSVDSARKLDNIQPVIQHTPPFTSTSNTGTITIKSVIKDNGIIRYTWTPEAPRLYYRKNSGSGWSAYSGITQSEVSADTFYFAIPGSSHGTSVEYYFAAQDIAMPVPYMVTLPPGGSGINPPGSTAPQTRFAFLVGTSSVISNGTIPDEFKLYDNYPNPFNPGTTIRFALKEARFVNIKIFDITGREVKRLIGENLPAGDYSVKFDAVKLSSGIYFYAIEAGDFRDVRRMTFIK